MYLKLLLFVILLQISGLSLPSKDAPFDASEVSAKFSLDKSTFLAGEPIWVTLTITNNDSTGIEVFTSDHQSSVQRFEYVFRAFDTAGKDVAPHSDWPPIVSGFDNEITIGPGCSRSIRIFLPDWFMMTSPGVFNLSCATTLRINHGERRQTVDDDCVAFKVATVIPLSVLPPNEEALGDLITSLGNRSFSTDKKIREEASRDLSVISDQRVIPVISRILANNSFDSTSDVDSSKDLALIGLAQFSTDAAETALLPALRSGDPWLRGNASIVLNEMKRGKLPLKILQKEMSDSSILVREQALDGLALTGDQSVYPIVLNALEDPDKNVRYTAAKALGTLSNKRAIPVLKAKLSDPDMRLRAECVQSLAKLKVPISPEWLMPIIMSPPVNGDDIASFEAVETMVSSCKDVAAYSLAKCLQFDSPDPTKGFNWIIVPEILTLPNGPKINSQWDSGNGDPATARANNMKLLGEIKTWMQSTSVRP